MKSTLLKTIAISITSIALVTAINVQAQLVVNLTVTSNPLWTDTGVMVSAGETVNITASGLWVWGAPDVPYTDAGGQYLVGSPWAADEFDEFVQNNYQGMLIGFVGTSPGSYGNWAPGPFFAIGDASTFTAPAGGELWLGFNDDMISDGVGDNSGSQQVTLTSDFNSIIPPAPVPEPTTIIAGALVLLPFGSNAVREVRKKLKAV